MSYPRTKSEWLRVIALAHKRRPQYRDAFLEEFANVKRTFAAQFVDEWCEWFTEWTLRGRQEW
jgi:hypothetical protein